MSVWTHVAGVIRLDSLRFDDSTPDWNELIGKECMWRSDNWDDYYYHPEEFLPGGSEGTLRLSTWVNPNISHTAAYTITIFGDLRDYDNPNTIIDWFKNKCEEILSTKGNGIILIRQAVITANNETETVSYTWEEVEE